MSSETLAAEIKANELRRRRDQEQCLRLEDTELTNNGRILLQNSRPSLDEHCMLKALFFESLGHKKILNNNIGNTRSLSMAHRDFESAKLHGRLNAKKNIQVVTIILLMKQ